MGCIYSKPLVEDRFIPEKTIRNVTIDDTIPYFPPITCGKVVKVYDGDTIHIASNEIPCSVPGKTFRFQIRIKNIDTPEIRTKNEQEKNLGRVAKYQMEQLVLNKFVTLEEVEHESKWGRILAVVKVDGISAGETMLDLGYAKPYNGKHKDPW
jgi:endonuclease YncB( thermonuclease family)